VASEWRGGRPAACSALSVTSTIQLPTHFSDDDDSGTSSRLFHEPSTHATDNTV